MKFRLFALLNSLLFTALVSAEIPTLFFQEGDVLPKKQYPAAYNASSQVSLENNKGGPLPDIFVDGSFLYYHADEEGLDLATSAGLASEIGGFFVVATSNSKTAFQEFKYKPGFKVGIGARFCEWTLAAEYTQLRQTTKTNRKAPAPNLFGAFGVWILNDWFQQISPVGQAISATSLNSKWHLSIDLADLTLSRPFYEGRNLSVSPFFGLRGAWIRQNMKVGIFIPTELISNQVSDETVSRNSSSSWAVGPRAGLEADCLLGKGFRLQGALAGSLLFTQYTHVTHKENVANSAAIPSSLRSRYTNYNCLRPIGEIGLGIGWGSYFSGQKCHIDFSAAYDFLVFWDQNMIRKLLDSVTGGIGASSGNLNLHGLTLTARLDF